MHWWDTRRRAAKAREARRAPLFTLSRSLRFATVVCLLFSLSRRVLLACSLQLAVAHLPPVLESLKMNAAVARVWDGRGAARSPSLDDDEGGKRVIVASKERKRDASRL